MEMQGRVSAHGSRFIILTVALGALMGSLDISIVNISIPSIARHFDASTSLASWIIIIYLLVLTCSLPAFGKIGDMKGFRIIFVMGFGIFAAGSLL